MGVVIKNPNYSLKKIQSIVEKKARWIDEKLALLNSRKYISKIYKEHGCVLIYGIKEPLHVKGKLSDFYKHKTKEIVPDLVNKWSLKMGLYPKKVLFRKTKRRWGSCSAKNELSFTSSLIQLPLECIEYVIMHELSHIKHKHHKKAFWLHVEKFMPNFKEHEQIIKNYSAQI